MSNFKERYNDVTGCIVFSSLHQLVLFVNENGGDLDEKNCTSGVSFQITTNAGDSYKAGGAAGPKQLFSLLNELYGFNINLQRSHRVGSVFTVFFDEYPFKEESTNEQEREETEKDLRDGTEEVSEEPNEENQEKEESWVEGLIPQPIEVSEETLEMMEELIENPPEPNEKLKEAVERLKEKPTAPEPDWKEIKTTNGWSKDKLDTYAESAPYNIKLDRRKKFYGMVAQFKEEFNSKFEAE